MPLQNLTPPPPAPQRTDDADTFVTRADAFVAWQSVLVAELTTLTAQLEATAALINVAPAYADPGLLAMTGRTPAADKFIYFTGASTSAIATVTAFGRDLMDSVDAADTRTLLNLNAFRGNTVGAIRSGASGSNFERLYVSADGAVHISGTRNAADGTVLPVSGNFRVQPATLGGYAYSAYEIQNYTAFQFGRRVSGVPAEIGTITVTDTAVSYNTTSDQNLKDDQGEFTPEQAWAIVDLIAIHNFNWKVNGQADIGPFAQELHAIYPNAVTVGGWFEEDGSPASAVTVGARYRPWSVDLSKLMPLIVVTTQDLRKTTEDMHQRLTALESK